MAIRFIVANPLAVDLKFICKIMAHDLKINIGSKFVLNALHPKAFDGRPHVLIKFERIN